MAFERWATFSTVAHKDAATNRVTVGPKHQLAITTVQLQDAPTLPHIGWNQVERTREHDLFAGIDDGADFYFVHSYAGEPPVAAHDVVLARTSHGRPSQGGWRPRWASCARRSTTAASTRASTFTRPG